MPFIPDLDRRRRLNDGLEEPETPGDMCYLAYQCMIDAWAESPRWTTADKINAKLIDMVDALATDYPKWSMNDINRAVSLAWQVFFVDEVMRYERAKKAENGAVTPNLKPAPTIEIYNNSWPGQSQGEHKDE